MLFVDIHKLLPEVQKHFYKVQILAVVRYLADLLATCTSTYIVRTYLHTCEFNSISNQNINWDSLRATVLILLSLSLFFSSHENV